MIVKEIIIKISPIITASVKSIGIYFLTINQPNNQNILLASKFNNNITNLYFSNGRKIEPQNKPKVTWEQAIKMLAQYCLSLAEIFRFICLLTYYNIDTNE